jgi:hypothetical protein
MSRFANSTILLPWLIESEFAVQPDGREVFLGLWNWGPYLLWNRGPGFVVDASQKQRLKTALMVVRVAMFASLGLAFGIGGVESPTAWLIFGLIFVTNPLWKFSALWIVTRGKLVFVRRPKPNVALQEELIEAQLGYSRSKGWQIFRWAAIVFFGLCLLTVFIIPPEKFDLGLVVAFVGVFVMWLFAFIPGDTYMRWLKSRLKREETRS